LVLTNNLRATETVSRDHTGQLTAVALLHRIAPCHESIGSPPRNEHFPRISLKDRRAKWLEGSATFQSKVKLGSKFLAVGPREDTPPAKCSRAELHTPLKPQDQLTCADKFR